MKCPKCDVQSDDPEYLRRHAVRKHKLSAESLYLILYCNGQRPKCQCGCSEELTTFHGMKLGYSSFRPGHQARIHNNWGHNEAVMKKSQETRRQMFNDGELTVWNSGKTKETDDRVRLNTQNMQKTIVNDENELKRRSNAMIQQWRIGNLMPLTGSSHSQWAGGTSSVQALARSHLYQAWTYPKLKAGNFHCSNCGSSSELCVHHDKERFSSILRKAIATVGENDDTYERKEAIADWVVDYHINNDVSGVVLCSDCHAKAHAAG